MNHQIYRFKSWCWNHFSRGLWRVGSLNGALPLLTKHWDCAINLYTLHWPHVYTELFIFFNFNFFCFLFFIIYFILFFNFTILYWFCQISTWIRHRYTRVPHPEPSSLLPPRTIPLELFKNKSQLARPLEKAMAPHSSTLAWKIPWMEKSGGMQSMGSLRVGHDWATSLSLFTCMHWWRKWQPTPVFLPGESQGHDWAT